MRLHTLLFTALFCGSLAAQVPQAFDFQAVARDASGNVLPAQAVSVRLTVHGGTASGAIAYQEVHTATTNAFGLFSLAVGQGSSTQGTFANVPWGAAPHFLQVELDAAGGSTYVDMGTTQLLSVPYALYAGGVNCATVSLLGDTLKQANGCFVIVPGISVANGGCLDADNDGFYDRPGCGPVDCDDAIATTNPGAVEICDGIDNNCNGQVDEGGVCDPCSGPNICTISGQCYANGQSNPDAPCLVCNAAISTTTWSLKAAGSPCGAGNGCSTFTCDGVGTCVETYSPAGTPCDDGNPNTTNDVCNGTGNCNGTPCPDADGDGFSTCAGDCDDSNPDVSPGAVESCDGIDNNCNGQVDEGNVCDPCSGPNICTISGQCYANGQSNPDAPCLVCNTAISTTTWSLKAAGSPCGVGNGCSTFTCDGVGTCVETYSPAGTPCDDGNPNTTNDVCNGTGNCNGTPCPDADADGFSTCAGDCDDSNPDVNPGAVEVCDGIDNNCNGQVDEGNVCDPCSGPNICTISGQCYANGQSNPDAPCLVCNTAISTSTWSLKAAGSPCGAGNGCSTYTCDGVGTCVQTYSPAGTPCDDGNPNTTNDVCNGTGNCIGTPCPDADGDGFSTCAGDCDDSNPNVNPGAVEICDGIDNDCDGQVDEGGVCD